MATHVFNPVSRHNRAVDENYLVSLSDLFIGVLFIFIILLMAFALNYRVQQNAAEEKSNDLETAVVKAIEKQEEQDRRITELKAQQGALESKNQELSDTTAERTALLQSVQKSLAARGVMVEIDTRNGVLRLPETLLFGSGKAEFQESGIAALSSVGNNLYDVVRCYSNVNSREQRANGCQNINKYHRQLEAIFIEGHTDNLPISTAAYKDNWDLSIARAKNTYLELTKASPDLETLKNDKGQPLLSFSAYADRRPIVDNDTDIGRQKNRRIDLRFIMALPKTM